MRSTNRHSFIRSLKKKGFKEGIVIKIGLYDLVTSTTLESNKSHLGNQGVQRPLLGPSEISVDVSLPTIPPPAVRAIMVPEVCSRRLTYSLHYATRESLLGS